MNKNQQEKTNKKSPFTMRTIHTLHGDQIDSIETYSDDYYDTDEPDPLRNSRIEENNPLSRILTLSEGDDTDISMDVMREMIRIRNEKTHSDSGEKRLAAQVNAVAVLDMIKNLQDGIKVSKKHCKLKSLSSYF